MLDTVEILGHYLRLDAPCPCGSGRTLAACCWDVRVSGPRMPGKRTTPRQQTIAYAHPDCYASATFGCSRTLDREHYISRTLLEYCDSRNALNVRGLPWRDGLPPSALTARVLCKAHNNALSPIDEVAGRLIRTLHERPAGLHFFSTLDIERWMVKTLCGLVAATAFRPPTGGSFQLQSESASIDFLFGGPASPAPLGLWIMSTTGLKVEAHPRFGFAPLTSPHSNVGTGFEMVMCGVKLWLVLIDQQPREGLSHRFGWFKAPSSDGSGETTVALLAPPSAPISRIWGAPPPPRG